MRIQSPLSHIREVLKQTKLSAENYYSVGINEAVTRAVLIDPVLRALGWDIANTQMIEVEKTVSKSHVDYALYNSDGDVKIIIEAKQLGAAFEPHMEQLIKYIFDFSRNAVTLNGIILTDGIQWRYYDDFHIAPFKDSKTLDVANGNLGEVAAFLVQKMDAANFWPEEQDVDVMAQSIADLQQGLAELNAQVKSLTARGGDTKISLAVDEALELDKVSNSNQSNRSQPLDENASQGWSELKLPLDFGRTEPTGLKLPDGKEIVFEVGTRTWNQVLIEICRFVLLQVPSLPIPYPNKAGRKVYLIDTKQPLKGRMHGTIESGGRTLYIYTHYSNNDKMNQALEILKQLPSGGAKVMVKYQSTNNAANPQASMISESNNFSVGAEKELNSSLKLQTNSTTVEVIRGGVDKQDVDAIVNAANIKLTDGAGITEIIFRDAGRHELTEEIQRKYPNGTPTGTAVITSGHSLKQPHIIHTPGPDYRQKLGNEPEKLASSYRSCLEVADANGLSSIAFCSISTGIYEYPLPEAAPLAVKTVKDYLEAHPQTSLRRVVFAMYQPEEFREFTQALETA